MRGLDHGGDVAGQFDRAGAVVCSRAYLNSVNQLAENVQCLGAQFLLIQGFMQVRDFVRI
ncbi:hypothetical protein [Nisaea sp.]|uniref:hypothetical protein n=1 Tax=Nisaea sp. TaxID=2024842 RepID=UPI0032ECAAA6